jgi:hypothetical protein
MSDTTHKAPAARRRRRRVATSLCVGFLVVAAVTTSLATLALAATSAYPDLPAGHPYYQAVTELASRGVISGYPDGTFGPENAVTRQQFAKMVVLTMGYEIPPGVECPFGDVDKTPNAVDPLYPATYVAVCALHGVTQGKTATLFDPYANISRLQVLTMVVRAADEVRPGLLVSPTEDFQPTWDPDASPTHGANAARAEFNGLLEGIDVSGLDPLGSMTRGEIAQVLYNLLVKLTPPTTTTTTESTTTTSSSTTTSSTTSTTCG